MNNRALKFAIVAGLLTVSPFATSEAQRENRGGNRQGGRPERAQMEQRFRQQLANMLRTQLGLNDDQMRQLSAVNQRFDVQRRELLRREMIARRSIREEVDKRDSADAGRIDQMLTEQFKLERERIDLTEAEQRELSKFLTPVQRARYLGVQEQIRREMDQLRGRRAGPMDGPTDRRRPPTG
jgi:hypothetical protein